MAFEGVQVRRASFQDVVEWCLIGMYDSEEAGIGFAGMEAENHCMDHSGGLEGHFGIEVVAHFETAADRSEIDLVARFEIEVVRSEIEEVHSGQFEMEGGHFETEEAVHSGIEAESPVRLAGGTVEAPQTPGLEVDQNLAVVGETEIVIAEKEVVAGDKIEERQSRTNFEVCLQKPLAVAAVLEGSLASRPCRNISA